MIQAGWQKLINHHKQHTGFTNTQTAIDSLVDEHHAAIKLFLPDMPSAQILYVGSNTDETAANLAAYFDRVTALFITQHSYQIQQEKQKLKGSSHTLNIGAFDFSTPLIAEGIFDGIIIDYAPEKPPLDDSNPDLPAILEKILPTLKPNGWFFLKCKNSLGRGRLAGKARQLLAQVRNQTQHEPPTTSFAKDNSYYSLQTCRNFLKKSGFINLQYFALEEPDSSTLQLIEFSNGRQIHHLTKKSKLRFLPHWLFRLTTPTFGILASRDNLPASQFKNIIKKVEIQLELAKGHQIHSIEINQKGKLVAILSQPKEEESPLILKIPVTENSARHMQHNFAGLQHIQKANVINNPNILPLPAFPTPILAGLHQATAFYVESAIIGKPLSQSGQRPTPHTVRQIESTLDRLKHIPPADEGNTNQEQLSSAISHVRSRIIESKPEEIDKFDYISLSVISAYKKAGQSKHFYKSDYSISNIFFHDSELKGIIDLDFWGTFHNRLVDYADFVFSYLRTFHGYNYAEAMKLIFNSKLPRIPNLANFEEMLSRLGGSNAEFINAAQISWINSVSHLLEFDRNRLNPEKLELILFTPIETIYQLLKESSLQNISGIR